ncbi:MAG: uncharacterized protein JWO12_3095 [Frankiales bacterium]|nr:uncharacterized protein [Frankiales bacterium]
MLALASLDDLVVSIAADRSLWEPHVRFTDSSRYWHRLLTLPGADVWLLTWLPDQYTDLHDHGDATATFTVVSGVLNEVRVRPGGTLVAADVPAGSLVTVPAGAVHDVANHSSSPAVSIHAYSPRLERMSFWEPWGDGLRRISTVLTDEPEVA